MSDRAIVFHDWEAVLQGEVRPLCREAAARAGFFKRVTPPEPRGLMHVPQLRIAGPGVLYRGSGGARSPAEPAEKRKLHA